MESVAVLYLICCILGFFEIGYPHKSGIKYWQSRYDFSDSMFSTFTLIGWILTLLAFIGFPGMLLGLIMAISKERKEKEEKKGFTQLLEFFLTFTGQAGDEAGTDHQTGNPVTELGEELTQESTVTTASRMARYFLKFFFIGNSSLNFDYLDLR